MSDLAERLQISAGALRQFMRVPETTTITETFHPASYQLFVKCGDLRKVVELLHEAAAALDENQDC